MTATQGSLQVFLDISIGYKYEGRLIISLFTSVVPRTCYNFKCLCTGDKGLGKMSGKPLHYKNSSFHRVIKGFMAQGGDFTVHNRQGGESVYGGKFADENFHRKHSKRGILSMANSGPNTNGSQFFLTFTACPHLDGKHVVFGEVIEGWSVLDKMEKVDVGYQNKPVSGQQIEIMNCGVVGEENINLEVKPEVKRKRSIEDIYLDLQRQAKEKETTEGLRHSDHGSEKDRKKKKRKKHDEDNDSDGRNSSDEESEQKKKKSKKHKSSKKKSKKEKKKSKKHHKDSHRKKEKEVVKQESDGILDDSSSSSSSESSHE
jgi:peptidyl-prolyl isomerase G (cyclophilin G)